MEIQSNFVIVSHLFIDYSPCFNGNIIYKPDIFQQAMSDYQMVSKKTLWYIWLLGSRSNQANHSMVQVRGFVWK